MESRNHGKVWEKVAERMTTHAERKDMPPQDVRILAALALFADEVSRSYKFTPQD